MNDATIKPPTVPKKYTRKFKLRWWGQDHDVTPLLADEYLGDGRLLLAFQPMDTRPDYYLVRIDSKTAFEDDEFLDGGIEEIYELLIDEFGERESERTNLANDLRERGIEPNERNTDLAGNEDRLGWPVVVDDCGASWWTVARFEKGKWK